MKKPALHFRESAGYTLLEVMIAVSVVALTTGGILECLTTGLNLYAKNTAMNSTHEEGRRGLNRLVRDIHSAVSVPQLIDANFNSINTQPVDANGKPTGTAGVSFQIVAHGPDYVFNDPGGNDKIMIMDNMGGTPYKPHEGLRLIVPMWGLEDDIYKVEVASTTGHHNVWCVNGSDVTVAKTKSANNFAITYYTSRVAYVVKNGTWTTDINGNAAYINGELHRYEQSFYNGNTTPVWTDVATVARYITSPTPFTVPLNTSGTPDDRYIGVKVSAGNTNYSNRGYHDISTLLNTAIPYRSKLTIYQ
jgi:prepilin-type N-terminal cleavage/methylation domain-containing protein